MTDKGRMKMRPLSISERQFRVGGQSVHIEFTAKSGDVTQNERPSMVRIDGELRSASQKRDIETNPNGELSMSRQFKITRAFAAAAISVAATSASAAMPGLYDGALVRVPADVTVGAAPGRSVAAHCQVGDHRSPDNWAQAAAHLILKQDATSSEVTVTMTDGRPDTLYTIWLMLAGKTADGESYGGNPLMKSGATALLPSSQLAEAVSIMKSPNSEAANGFVTDATGFGTVTVKLDFPIVGGAYPFQRFEGFDATDPAYTRDAPRAVPVAITDKSAGAPFTLRLASHCGDNLHNGLVAGPHEAWFNWLAD